MLCVAWNVVNDIWNDVGVLEWMGLCMSGLVTCNGFFQSSSLGWSILFGTEWNILMTKSETMRAGIPSMFRPASREVISACVDSPTNFIFLFFKLMVIPCMVLQLLHNCWVVYSQYTISFHTFLCMTFHTDKNSPSAQLTNQHSQFQTFFPTGFQWNFLKLPFPQWIMIYAICAWVDVSKYPEHSDFGIFNNVGASSIFTCV